MKNNLKLVGYAAIIQAIILIPSFILGILAVVFKDNLKLKYYTLAAMVPAVILGIVILMGYVYLAKKLKLVFLERIGYAIIFFAILFNALSAFTLFNEKIPPLLGLIFLIIAGVFSILLGIAILKLKKEFGEFVTSIGVLYIVAGVFDITIFLVILLPLVSVVITILEAILFFRAAKKF